MNEEDAQYDQLMKELDEMLLDEPDAAGEQKKDEVDNEKKTAEKNI